MTMDRVPVKSSSLRSVGYDDKNQELEVEFASGALYTYSGVSQQAHDDLMVAESAGRHFAKHIRSNFSCCKGGQSNV